MASGRFDKGSYLQDASQVLKIRLSWVSYYEFRGNGLTMSSSIQRESSSSLAVPGGRAEEQSRRTNHDSKRTFTKCRFLTLGRESGDEGECGNKNAASVDIVYVT